MANLIAIFCLFALLRTISAKSLRRGAGHDEQRELQNIANIIRTFSISIVASEPQNPANVTSCLLLNTQGSTIGWLNKTYPSETVVAVSAPIIYTSGSSWPGRRNLVAAKCTYACIIQQTMSCNFCGGRKLSQEQVFTRRTTFSVGQTNLNGFSSLNSITKTGTTGNAIVSFTTTNIANSNNTIVNSTKTNTTTTTTTNITNTNNTIVNSTTTKTPTTNITILNSTTTNSTTTNVLVNSTKTNGTTVNSTATNSTKTTSTATATTSHATASTATPNVTTTTTELVLEEYILEFLLPFFCPQIQDLTSVVVMVTEQYIS